MSDLSDLPRKWRDDILDYPQTSEGLHAATAVKLCAQELEAALPAHDAAVRAEAEARLRRVEECGHPGACLELNDPDGAWCRACDSQQRAVAEATAGAYEAARGIACKDVVLDAMRGAVGVRPFGYEIADEIGRLTSADAQRALAERDERVRNEAVGVALEMAALLSEDDDNPDRSVPNAQAIRALHDRVMERLKWD